MSEPTMSGTSATSSDREYLWFALLLMVVLTTSIGHSPTDPRSAPVIADSSSQH
jgi:hypothetical protein